MDLHADVYGQLPGFVAADAHRRAARRRLTAPGRRRASLLAWLPVRGRRAPSQPGGRLAAAGPSAT